MRTVLINKWISYIVLLLQGRNSGLKPMQRCTTCMDAASNHAMYSALLPLIAVILRRPCVRPSQEEGRVTDAPSPGYDILILPPIHRPELPACCVLLLLLLRCYRVRRGVEEGPIGSGKQASIVESTRPRIPTIKSITEANKRA